MSTQRRYRMPDHARIMDKNGILTPSLLFPPLDQVATYDLIKAQYITKGEKNRWPNLSQALNDVFGAGGKATQPYTQDKNAVIHASAGDPDTTSVAVFYYVTGVPAIAIIFAVGQHVSIKAGQPIEYRVTDLWQPNGDFTKNAKITLK